MRSRPSRSMMARSKLWSSSMKHDIMKRMAIICVATATLALPLLVGCDREVSSTKSSSESNDGTVKSKEKTVTETKDGTVTKTEESKTTISTNKP